MTEFEKRLLAKKEKQRLEKSINISQQLPHEYIDSGIIDNRFKQQYGQGVSADEDFFGKSFAEHAIAYALKKINEQKNLDQQKQTTFNFVKTVACTHDYIFGPSLYRFKKSLTDPITGVSNHQELINHTLDEVKKSTLWDSKKELISKVMEPMEVKTHKVGHLRRIK